MAAVGHWIDPSLRFFLQRKVKDEQEGHPAVAEEVLDGEVLHSERQSAFLELGQPLCQVRGLEHVFEGEGVEFLEVLEGLFVAEHVALLEEGLEVGLELVELLGVPLLEEIALDVFTALIDVIQRVADF